MRVAVDRFFLVEALFVAGGVVAGVFGCHCLRLWVGNRIGSGVEGVVCRMNVTEIFLNISSF